MTAVASGSLAEKAGLLTGDAITAVGTHPATGLFVLHTAAVEAVKARQPLQLTVSRGGETLTISLPLAGPTAAQ